MFQLHTINFFMHIQLDWLPLYFCRRKLLISLIIIKNMLHKILYDFTRSTLRLARPMVTIGTVVVIHYYWNCSENNKQYLIKKNCHLCSIIVHPGLFNLHFLIFQLVNTRWVNNGNGNDPLVLIPVFF